MLGFSGISGGFPTPQSQLTPTVSRQDASERIREQLLQQLLLLSQNWGQNGSGAGNGCCSGGNCCRGGANSLGNSAVEGARSLLDNGTGNGNSRVPSRPQDPPPTPKGDRQVGQAEGSAPAAKVQDAPVNPSGAAFPVAGYKGDIPLHWGSFDGAADLFAPRGTPVVSMRDGVVESAGTDGAGGNNVMIRGEDGLVYYYAHMDQPPTVTPGQKVKAGQKIGEVGDSGNAKGTGPHLHLGIGKSIMTGVGPTGGGGTDFDANRYLKDVLAGK